MKKAIIKLMFYNNCGIDFWWLAVVKTCKWTNQTKQSKRWNLFWLFWRVREIGFPFSHLASRPFCAIFGENEADIFEVTDVERRPRSNFLDHFHYSQAVTFWVIALNRPIFVFFLCPLLLDFSYIILTLILIYF